MLVNPVVTTSQSKEICPGATFTRPGGGTATTAGTYTDTITSVKGCDSIIVTTLTINSPSANAGADVTIVNGTTTQLNASGGTTYTWSPAMALSCMPCPDPVASPTVTTTYFVTSTNAGNCTATDSITVTVVPPCNDKIDINTFIPNAFSPNNDGWNDLLCIPQNICIQDIILKVYDRWGELVFDLNDPTQCWNGIYKGKELHSSVFVYYLRVEFESGETRTAKGNISLIK